MNFYFESTLKNLSLLLLYSTLPSGTLEKSSHHITVTHASGQYSLGLFDHIKVGVRVDVPHAHAPSLSFQLLSFKATPPDATPTGSLESMPKKELVKVHSLLLPSVVLQGSVSTSQL